ncbi:MAG: hypothetical protein M1832_003975 [Thelocarpon impressellum]|nr:MAG: hypothetical protein M1832_003975 [Thelocarpon impressellum]
MHGAMCYILITTHPECTHTKNQVVRCPGIDERASCLACRRLRVLQTETPCVCARCLATAMYWDEMDRRRAARQAAPQARMGEGGEGAGTRLRVRFRRFVYGAE